jgi:hypothetical protein
MTIIMFISLMKVKRSLVMRLSRLTPMSNVTAAPIVVVRESVAVVTVVAVVAGVVVVAVVAVVCKNKCT